MNINYKGKKIRERDEISERQSRGQTDKQT